MKTYDVVAVGNATIDAFLTIHDANVHCRIDEKACELCVRYGEKIMLDNCTFQPGGDACNVSVGFSRLGLLSSLVAEIGDDEFSQKIIHGLAKENVDKQFLLQTKDVGSSFAIGLQFQGERTLFVEHVERKHAFVLDGFLTKWVYLTSLGKEWKQAYSNVLRYVEQSGCKLAFNPGTPQLGEGYSAIADIMQKTDVFIVNKEEAIKICDVSDKNMDIKELLLTVQTKGPKMVVITDGKNGSFVVEEHGEIHQMGIVPATVVGKTGAGDAFSSGFLCAILSGKNVADAMKWGSVNAASVVGFLGAQVGLLHKDEMQKKLQDAGAEHLEANIL